MDISQLKYFIALAQTRSFSEAARRCGISQPSMSHGISTLEKQLGAPLFLRSRKSVTITDAGKILLPSAMQIVETAEKAEFRIRQIEIGATGSIEISALTTSSAALSSALTVFTKKYPNIMTDISFTSGRSEVIAMSESKGDVHFAVQDMVPKGELYHYVISHHDHLCMAFPADHPLAKEELDFSKLKNERFIGISETDGPTLRNEIERVCESRGYKPNIVCQYDRAEAVLLSVGSGSGIAVIPEALGKVFYLNNVVLKRIPGEDAIRTYVMAWQKDIQNPAARLFIEMSREYFSSHPSWADEIGKISQT